MVAFDDGEDESIPSINIFRKTNGTYQIVKIIDGEEAAKLYSILTKEGEADAACSKL